jgi:hypothetical protein
MKTLVCLVFAASGLAGPVVSFAQSTEPITRAQVYADLIRVEQAGYHIGDGDNTTYPAEIQAAEAKIAAQDSQHAALDNAVDNAVGGTTTTGTSASGARLDMPRTAPSSCTGPTSYCNIFFGS